VPQRKQRTRGWKSSAAISELERGHLAYSAMAEKEKKKGKENEKKKEKENPTD
jgi:hypothetical protein